MHKRIDPSTDHLHSIAGENTLPTILPAARPGAARRSEYHTRGSAQQPHTTIDVRNRW